MQGDEAEMDVDDMKAECSEQEGNMTDLLLFTFEVLLFDFLVWCVLASSGKYSLSIWSSDCFGSDFCGGRDHTAYKIWINANGGGFGVHGLYRNTVFPQRFHVV